MSSKPQYTSVYLLPKSSYDKYLSHAQERGKCLADLQSSNLNVGQVNINDGEQIKVSNTNKSPFLSDTKNSPITSVNGTASKNVSPRENGGHIPPMQQEQERGRNDVQSLNNEVLNMLGEGGSGGRSQTNQRSQANPPLPTFNHFIHRPQVHSNDQGENADLTMRSAQPSNNSRTNFQDLNTNSIHVDSNPQSRRSAVFSSQRRPSANLNSTVNRAGHVASPHPRRSPLLSPDQDVDFRQSSLRNPDIRQQTESLLRSYQKNRRRGRLWSSPPISPPSQRSDSNQQSFREVLRQGMNEMGEEEENLNFMQRLNQGLVSPRAPERTWSAWSPKRKRGAEILKAVREGNRNVLRK